MAANVSIVRPAAAVAPAARRVRRPPQFYAGAAVLCLVAVVAIFAPWISPHGFADQDLIKSLQAPA